MSLMYVGIPRCSFLFYFPIKIKVQRGFFFCKAEINSKRREITKMKCISLADSYLTCSHRNTCRECHAQNHPDYIQGVIHQN